MKGIQEDNPKSLSFVKETVSGLRVSTLVDTGTTHSLVSSRTVSSLHSSLEGSQAWFKAVNSEMKLVTERVDVAPLTFGTWKG